MSTVTQEKDYGHVPVLLHECLDALAIKPDGIYVDGTLGRAGHSLEIVKRLTTGRLIGIDRDETAIAAAQERLADYGDRVTLVHSNFDRIGDILADLHIDGADGMLFDLGVSSPQLDDAERGFSYMHDAPLDMRMDRTAYLTAREVVNSWSYEELRRILFEYGEERYAPAIAKRIVQHREQQPIETTLELVDIIKSAMPPQALREKQHPAKRSFQAIRIAVNGELEESRFLQEMVVLSDKLDVSEELTRLHAHLERLRDLLEIGTDAGRRLDFTLQECFREIATCGNKIQDAQTSRLVVDFKNELEKCREQVQNLE